MLRGGVTGWTMCWLCRRTQLAGLEGHECDQNWGSGLPGLEGGGARGQVYSPVSRLGGERYDLRGEDTAFGVPTMESSPRLGMVSQQLPWLQEDFLVEAGQRGQKELIRATVALGSSCGQHPVPWNRPSPPSPGSPCQQPRPKSTVGPEAKLSGAHAWEDVPHQAGSGAQ